MREFRGCQAAFQSPFQPQTANSSRIPSLNSRPNTRNHRTAWLAAAG
jgi:hypothetical protein